MRKNQKFNRRFFLKSSVLGASGALLSTTGFAMNRNGEKSTEADIITRKLGKTGIEIPVISMGVMNSDNPNLVKAALDAGMKLFDTAHGYMGGRNEEMLGEVFKNTPRESIIMATKIPAQERGRRDQTPSGPTRENFLEKLDISLKRLQMDYVDILYQHNVTTREAVLNEIIIDALLTAKKQGKTRFIGVTTHRNEPEVIMAAAESGVLDVVLTSINFKQDHYPQVKEAIAKASAKGIGIVAMKTLAGGYMDRERQIPVNTTAALKWVLQDPNVCTCIPGMTAFDQLEKNVEVMRNITLTEEEIKDLDLQGEETGMYCLGCEKCIPACRKNLPVPDIMRAYMYTYGYRNLEKAHNVLVQNDIPVDPCAGCDQCTVACTKGFAVREKIQDVSRLRDIPVDFIS